MEVKDILSLLIGSIVVDTIIIGMNYGRFVFVSDVLTRWYTELRISAMIMDCGIIVLYAVIGILLSRRAGWEEYPFLTLSSILGTQLVGDVLFYLFFRSLPRGSYVFDIFKDYSSEVGWNALWADSVMMTGTYLISLLLSDSSTGTNLLLLIASAYVSQYVLYLKKE